MINYVKHSPIMGLTGFGGGASNLNLGGLGYGPGTGKWYGDYAYYTGGNTASGGDVDHIQKWTIQSTSNASDVGNLQNDAKYSSATSSGDYCFHFGGDSGSKEEHISKFAGTGGNSSLFANMASGMTGVIPACDGVRLIQAGGSSGPHTEEILYWNPADSSEGSTTFGNLSVKLGFCNPVNDATRMVTTGGVIGTPNWNGKTDAMEYITFASESNSTSFGDMTEITYHNGSVSDATRGVSVGGNTPDTTTHSDNMEYITIQTTGNMTDFGNLNNGKYYPAGGSDMTRGSFGGGWGGGFDNTIEYITIQSTGNATDQADLAYGTGWGGGCAGG